jgi:hypothetical protein
MFLRVHVAPPSSLTQTASLLVAVPPMPSIGLASMGATMMSSGSAGLTAMAIST